MLSFNEADQVVHPVEKQWHYPILTRYGFTPVTLEAKGFVRSYKYENTEGVVVTCNTGASCDYWTGSQSATQAAGQGYWSALEPWLKKL